MDKVYQIALDGPSGAGKSSVAKAVAALLGIIYVDTGALYRTVGYYVWEAGADPRNEAEVGKLLPKIQIDLTFDNGVQKVLLNGEWLGEKIRTPEISRYASDVSALPPVRQFLLDTQRSIAKTHSVIMDGRDIGTVIFPNAKIKIFLTASDEVRAKRRCEELKMKGLPVEYEKILAEMRERDHNDSHRSVAPAVPAADAVILDNSNLNLEETAQAILAIVDSKLNK